MTPIIEPCAARLFDIYYRHTSQQSMHELQCLTEEAYKLHERLRKFTKANNGLFDLDEFLLLKALRNYSVHRGDFVGEAFGIDFSFAQQLNLDLIRVCLIDKNTLNKAINFEPILNHGEDKKISRIKSQLVEFGGFYNIEPVIYNFMVKVYEKLITLKLTIPGGGFTELDRAYKNETYYNFPHYIPLSPADVDADEIAQHLIPLVELNLADQIGLIDSSNDPFNKFLELKLDYSDLKFAGYTGDDYELMRDSLIKKIIKTPESLEMALFLPSHIGLAFLSPSDSSEGLITCFNIAKQKEVFNKHNINLDNVFYETTANELLCCFFYDNNVFPVIIYKSELQVPHS